VASPHGEVTVRFASWRLCRRFIEAVRLLLHIREANASFLLAIRPKVCYNEKKAVKI